MKFMSTKSFLLLSSFLLLASCGRDEEQVDTEKPVLTLGYAEAFPKSCAVLKRGETYVFRACATDNVGVASYGIDVHHNFDHHTHDDQPGVCALDDKKNAVKPMIYMQNFSVPNADKNFEIQQQITIPQDVDFGDYHCSISVTDQTGWQTRTSVDIKIIP